MENATKYSLPEILNKTISFHTMYVYTQNIHTHTHTHGDLWIWLYYEGHSLISQTPNYVLLLLHILVITLMVPRYYGNI